MPVENYRPRIIGLETEYGCLVTEGLQAHRVIGKIRQWVFDHSRHGLIDLHHRDWDEPPGNGGFLFNGGRLYEDMGHLEMCTPECASIREVALYDRANDLMLHQALRELGLADSVSIIRNNIDHYTGATFGCHENYLMRRKAPLSDENVFSLLGFLTLRSLYTGAGRVGGLEYQRSHKGSAPHPFLSRYRGYQITQRADYVENDFFRWVQGNRAIINTRDEPLADPQRFRRLHLLHGDTNVLPSALFLKLGATSLVLDLLEADAMPRVRLADPVLVLKSLSYNPERPWPVELIDGEVLDAVEVLELYRTKCVVEFGGRDEETDLILAFWKDVNEDLSTDPNRLIGILDWVSKKFLLESFCEEQGLPLHDPWLEAQDLEFHNIHPDKGLGLALAKPGPWLEPGPAVERCLVHPPLTRAAGRSKLMRQVAQDRESYVIDWDAIRWGDHLSLFTDPYSVEPQYAELPPEKVRLP